MVHDSNFVSFLDQADRIARLSYTPTTGCDSFVFWFLLLIDYTEDILRARLRTLGVEEHRLTMETGKLLWQFSTKWMADNTGFLAIEKGKDWIFYDVGGARGQRGKYS